MNAPRNPSGVFTFQDRTTLTFGVAWKVESISKVSKCSA
jgi:hypothetical protein